MKEAKTTHWHAAMSLCSFTKPQMVGGLLVIGLFVCCVFLSGFNAALLMRHTTYPANSGPMRVLNICAILSQSSLVIFCLFARRGMRKRKAYTTDPASPQPH